MHGLVRFWLVQASLVCLFTITCLFAANTKAALSVLLGGVVGIIPNVIFARKLFKHQGARAARQIVNGFYTGEALKLLLSIFLFTIVFALCKVQAGIFFATYILILMTHWFIPWVVVN